MAPKWQHKEIAEIITEGMEAFAGINAGDSVVTGTGKVALITAKRTVYYIADYWPAGLTAAANVALKAWSVPLPYAFGIMWVIDIVIAGAFLIIYAKTGHDLSLGEDLRRASDAMHRKFKIVGYLAMLGVIIQATFWSGPEQVVIFFRKEIGAMPKLIAVMLFLAAIQTVVWMYIYRADLIVDGFNNPASLQLVRRHSPILIGLSVWLVIAIITMSSEDSL